MDERVELPLSTLLWQPRPQAWLVTVVCKATFTLAPNDLKLASAHEAIATSDSFWDDDENRSLSLASDVVPSKPKADVVLVGSAFAPQGKAVRSLVARLAFESIDKSVEVVTDRTVGGDGTVYQGPRFARMPVVYERAAGGPGTWNPVGVRAGSRDAYGRTPLPNITPVGKGEELGRLPAPIGFGPIAPSWPGRGDRAGARAGLLARTWMNEPLPEGADLGFFNVAPPDQQIDAIPEDGALLLENLHRDHAVLACKLPGIKARVTVDRRGGKERPAMRPDTLWIDTDRSLVTLSWRGHFALEHPQETYRVTASAERPRQSWRTVEHAAPGRETMLDAMDVTSDGGGLPAGFALPASPPLERSSAPTRDPRPSAGGALPFQNIGRAAERKAPRGALPFADSDNPPTKIAPSVPTGTQQIADALPFGDQGKASPAWASSFGGYPAPPAPTPAFSTPASVVPPPAPSQPMPLPPQVPLSVPAVAAAQPGVVAATSAYAKPSADGWGAVGAPAVQVQPPAVVTHSGAAALGGITSASNAAADPRVAAGSAGLAPRRIEGDVLQLLWFNPEAAARVRRKPEWKKLLDQLEQGPFDPEIDEPGLAEEPAEMEDRREVYEVLARGAPSGQDSVDKALLDAVRSDGRFAAQLLLLLGEVRFDFDEIETLKATLSAAAPFAPTDEELKKTVDGATHFLSTPGLVAAPDVASAMTTKVRDAFLATSRPVPPTYLDDQTERALLERRAYQKRPVFGEPHLRSLFFFGGSSTGIPTYLPEAVSKKLPLFRRLRARMLVEAHFQADQYESHAAALKLVAIARVVR